jgi:hypothetical protein
VSARELVLRQLPVARRGLVDAGVEPGEADLWLSTIRDRVESGMTGAQWQRGAHRAALARTGDEATAATTMLTRYADLSDTDAPVHSWPAPGD